MFILVVHLDLDDNYLCLGRNSMFNSVAEQAQSWRPPWPSSQVKDTKTKLNKFALNLLMIQCMTNLTIFFDQNGIWVKFQHFWPENEGEKWYRKNIFEIAPCTCNFLLNEFISQKGAIYIKSTNLVMKMTWRNFKNIFSRPLFTIIFRPEMLKFHPYSILEKQCSDLAYTVFQDIFSAHYLNKINLLSILEQNSTEIVDLCTLANFHILSSCQGMSNQFNQMPDPHRTNLTLWLTLCQNSDAVSQFIDGKFGPIIGKAQ